jgi:exopolyphosphatase/guanosine-5'-triphosphate,3'-diphosphate pyrophosphatase
MSPPNGPRDILEDPGVSAVRRWMYSFGWHPEHMEQVSRLAILLFDRLEDLHGFDSRWRRVLAAAALAHDVGWTVAAKGHHKHAARLIRKASFPGFTPKERSFISLVARYHRRAKPKRSHRRFDRLDPADQDAVRKLAAILRIADGFDRSHTASVTGIECSLTGDEVTIRPRLTRAADEDVAAAYRKSGLFEETFHRRVVIVPLQAGGPAGFPIPSDS